MSPPRRTGGQEGSLAVELAFLTPVLFLLLGLVFAYGRVSEVNGALDAGARDGARVASQARTLTDANDAAQRTVAASMGSRCLDGGPRAGVIGVFDAGVPVKVTAVCRYSLSGLIPGLPGTITAQSTFTSPVDPNRGIDGGVSNADPIGR